MSEEEQQTTKEIELANAIENNKQQTEEEEKQEDEYVVDKAAAIDDDDEDTRPQFSGRSGDHYHPRTKYVGKYLLIEIECSRSMKNKKPTLEVVVNDDEENPISGYIKPRQKEENPKGCARIIITDFEPEKISFQFDQCPVVTFQMNDISWNKQDVDEKEGINDRSESNKITLGNKNQYGVILCKESVITYKSYGFPDEDECNSYIHVSNLRTFTKNIGDDYRCPDFTIYQQTRCSDDAEIFPKLAIKNMQIYYDKYTNTVYGIDNKTSRYSHVFFPPYKRSFFSNDDEKGLMMMVIETVHNRGLTGFVNSMSDFELYYPWFYQNITELYWLTIRYYWLKIYCLYGQDNEFNIFRSLCFIDNTKKGGVRISERLGIALLTLILQIFLTIGVVMEVLNNWDLQLMFEMKDNWNDTMVQIISFLVFAFLSNLYYVSVTKFLSFYTAMTEVCNISIGIIILDFISNIFVGFIVLLCALFYLLQSPEIVDVVLNSFALTFIIELDDIANSFESDEEALLQTDINAICDKYDPPYIKQTRQRAIVLLVPSNIVCGTTCRILFDLIKAPLYIIGAVFIILKGFKRYFVRRKQAMTEITNSDM